MVIIKADTATKLCKIGKFETGSTLLAWLIEVSPYRTNEESHDCERNLRPDVATFPHRIFKHVRKLKLDEGSHYKKNYIKQFGNILSENGSKEEINLAFDWNRNHQRPR